MCGKAVLNAPFLLKYYLSWYQTQEVCDKAVDDFLPALKFVPGWFVTSKRIRRLKNLIMFYLQTVICFSLVKILVMSGNATFSTDEMGTLNFDLNNTSLNDANWDEDDSETFIHAKTMAWRNRFKQYKSFKKDISK